MRFTITGLCAMAVVIGFGEMFFYSQKAEQIQQLGAEIDKTVKIVDTWRENQLEHADESDMRRLLSERNQLSQSLQYMMAFAIETKRQLKYSYFDAILMIALGSLALWREYGQK